MKTFVVAYLDFLKEGIISMKKFQASSKEEALRKSFLSNICPNDFRVMKEITGLTYEEIRSYAADADIAIEILEI